MEMSNELSGAALSRRAMLTAATAAGAVIGLSGAEAGAATPGDFGAPLAELHFPAGVLTAEQKAAMIKGVTEVLLRAMQLPTEQAAKLWVQIFETAEGGWGLGGQVLVPRGK
jgi:phenylpyruvate tautomerase PptA (4-oxalocrotonate tautomerase family)